MLHSNLLFVFLINVSIDKACHTYYTVMHNSIIVITYVEVLVKIIISNISSVPIYEQIKRQIKSAILSGELQEEEQLPSLRTLAKDLKISVLTVTRAYTELEQEGFVKNVQGRGCFVMGRGSELIREQLICKVENSLMTAIEAAKMANLSMEELHNLLNILMEVKIDE